MRHKCFGGINEPLKQLFNLSLENKIFPEKINIAKVEDFSKMVTLKTLQATAQYLFVLISFI